MLSVLTPQRTFAALPIALLAGFALSSERLPREVGNDASSFPKALRSALREDPDVLLVGGMRDLESISFALKLAETGHLVFATLPTNDTALRRCRSARTARGRARMGRSPPS